MSTSVVPSNLQERIVQFSRPTRSTCAHFSPAQWKDIFPRAAPTPPSAQACVRAGVLPPCRSDPVLGVDFPVNKEEHEAEKAIKACLESPELSVRLVHVPRTEGLVAPYEHCADLVAESGVFGTAVALEGRHRGTTEAVVRPLIKKRLEQSGATLAEHLANSCPILTLAGLHSRAALAMGLNTPIWTLIVLGAGSLGSIDHWQWARAMTGGSASNATIRAIVLVDDFSVPARSPGFSLAHYYFGDGVAFEMRERALQHWSVVEANQLRYYATTTDLTPQSSLVVWLTRDNVPKDGSQSREKGHGVITVSAAGRLDQTVGSSKTVVLLIRLDVAQRLSLEDWTLVGGTVAIWCQVLLVAPVPSTGAPPVPQYQPATFTSLVERSYSRPPRLTVDMPEMTKR